MADTDTSLAGCLEMRARAHTHTHTRTPTHTLKHTHTRPHTHTYKRTYTHTRPHTHAPDPILGGPNLVQISHSIPTFGRLRGVEYPQTRGRDRMGMEVETGRVN